MDELQKNGGPSLPECSLFDQCSKIDSQLFNLSGNISRLDCLVGAIDGVVLSEHKLSQRNADIGLSKNLADMAQDFCALNHCLEQLIRRMEIQVQIPVK